MITTVYRNGRIYSATHPQATALSVRDTKIIWIGSDADAPRADVTIDLGGAFVAPAFVDAHVHTTYTGLALLGLDLSGTRSAGEVLDLLASHAARFPGDAVLVGHGWDESTWSQQQPPSAPELDRAGGHRSIYLSQASVHSAIVSSALLRQIDPSTPGYDSCGWLRRNAHQAARKIAMGTCSTAQRDMAQRAALRKAASLGIVAVHECGGPGMSDEDDFTRCLALGRDPTMPDVFGYWGELGSATKARELGAVGAAGDLYADGAVGSGTAHLHAAYIPNGKRGGESASHHGHGYLTAEQVGTHLIDCTELGIQGGFHAIGDAALGTVLKGFRIAADKLGINRIRAARHRIEHAVLLEKQSIAGFVRYGIIASVQPAFDRMWGGVQAMYAQRLGTERSLASNPIAALAGAGVSLAFGTDSPVAPLDPWATIRAAMQHHNPVHRISAKAAFAAHTRGGWRAVHRDGEGAIVPGSTATFAVWDTPSGLTDGLPTLISLFPRHPYPELPTCLRAVAHGATIFNAQEP